MHKRLSRTCDGLISAFNVALLANSLQGPPTNSQNVGGKQNRQDNEEDQLNEWLGEALFARQQRFQEQRYQNIRSNSKSKCPQEERMRTSVFERLVVYNGGTHNERDNTQATLGLEKKVSTDLRHQLNAQQNTYLEFSNHSNFQDKGTYPNKVNKVNEGKIGQRKIQLVQQERPQVARRLNDPRQNGSGCTQANQTRISVFKRMETNS